MNLIISNELNLITDLKANYINNNLVCMQMDNCATYTTFIHAETTGMNTIGTSSQATTCVVSASIVIDRIGSLARIAIEITVICTEL